ncbi:MAG: hypothetical protein H7Y15_05560 [Pseudonocardia sp.]|nr:hypothetical protein [Pseudonocardia sp.]
MTELKLLVETNRVREQIHAAVKDLRVDAAALEAAIAQLSARLQTMEAYGADVWLQIYDNANVSLYLSGPIFEVPLDTPEGKLRRFVDWLERYWRDSSTREAEGLWSQDARQNPDRCRETLSAIEAILLAPPPDLHELIREHGWVVLRKRGSWNESPEKAYREWLRDIHREWSKLVEPR